MSQTVNTLKLPTVKLLRHHWVLGTLWQRSRQLLVVKRYMVLSSAFKSDDEVIVEKEVKVVSEDIRSVNGRATSRH